MSLAARRGDGLASGGVASTRTGEALRPPPEPTYRRSPIPVFHAHIPRGRFSAEDKRALADAFNRALVEALNIPAEDRFVILSEHGPDELFLHPTFMEMNRDAANAMIITVMIGAHRPIEDKRQLAATIARLVVETAGVTPDDVFLTLVPVPNENFSFGRGELQLADSAPKW